MKTGFLILLVASLGACAGASAESRQASGPYGHWEGYVFRNGLRAPVSVDLSGDGESRMSTGPADSVALQSVRVDGNAVHFELPGSDAFDGAASGNAMAGSVSGPESGAFELTRVGTDHFNPYPNGP